MKTSIVLFLTLLFLCDIYGQNNDIKRKKYWHFSANIENGKILPTTEFVSGNNHNSNPITRYQSYSLRALWQNPGYTHWQQVFRVPYYGFGISLNNFFNEQEIGYPVSAYGIIGMPVLRRKAFQLFSEFQYGMAAGWRYYKKNTNEYNMAIGSPITVHVAGGLNAFFKLSPKTEIGLGAGFVHFSNGGMERPNRGMNILSTSAKINYHFAGQPDVNAIQVSHPKEKERGLLLMMGYGNHQLVEHELDSNYFAIGGISAIYLEQLTQAFRMGAGVDMNYWWGLNANTDGTIAPRDFSNLTIGFILQPEIIIDRLTLVGGIGIYIRHRNYGDLTQMYQRLGARYEFYKNLSFGVNVRAINYMLAEFMEFNLAYRIAWNK